MMGTRDQPCSSSILRISTVASQPSMMGMSQSMKMMCTSDCPLGSLAASDRSLNMRSTAILPLLADTTSWPSMSSMLRATSMLYSESSAAKTLARPREGAATASGLGASPPTETWLVMMPAVMPAFPPLEGTLLDSVSIRSDESVSAKGPVARCSAAAAAGVAMDTAAEKVTLVPSLEVLTCVWPPMVCTRARQTARPELPCIVPLFTDLATSGCMPLPVSRTSKLSVTVSPAAGVKGPLV
mmetsp:Transcript_12922/g.34452  ORF Transcript_12922/g.34452 Transcript_12922/m.34452 type:complete len:241 (+) Transcript_12922:1032-1754(+)